MNGFSEIANGQFPDENAVLVDNRSIQTQFPAQSIVSFLGEVLVRIQSPGVTLQACQNEYHHRDDKYRDE